MATLADIERAEDILIYRIAERINDLEDRGTTRQQVKEQLVARTRPNRWIALMVCDPRVTARELTHLAEVLGTTTTWLLTGRQPEPTPHALRRHTTAQGGPTS